MSEQDVVKEFTAAYQQAVDKWDVWWTRAERSLEFVMGKQHSAQDIAKLKAQEREPLVFNRTSKAVELLSGYERKNRLSLKVEPLSGSQETAAQLSECVMWNMNWESIYLTMSDAFQYGALISGINLLELYMDYGEDPVSGNIKCGRVAYNSFLMDPYFTQRDMGDCRYVMRRRWLSKGQVRALLPEVGYRTINAIRPKGPDQKFPKSPPNKDFLGKNLLKLDQFWRQDSKSVKFLLNKINGQFKQWEKTTAELEKYLSQPIPGMDGVNIGQVVDVIPKRINTVKLSYLCENQELYSGPDPTGLEDYPLVPSVGYFYPEYDRMEWKLQGIVHRIIDPQVEGNRRRIKALDILDTAQHGIKAKSGSVVDKDVLFQRGQGLTVFIEDDKNMDDVQTLQPPPFPQGLLEFMVRMDEDTDDLLGLASEVTGMPDKGEAAESFILAKLRQSAGLTVFQPLMDGHRDTQKLLGQKLIRLIQLHFSPEKVQRIIKKKPTPEFYNKEFGKYDCIPTEGALTDSQRQMRYGEALALKAKFPTDCPLPWSKILEYSTLEIAPDMLQAIQKREQMQMQIQNEKIKGELMAMKAAAAYDMARAQAAGSKATLDRVKAAEEMSTMDTERMLKLIELGLRIEKEGGFGIEGSQPGGTPQLPGVGGHGQPGQRSQPGEGQPSNVIPMPGSQG